MRRTHDPAPWARRPERRAGQPHVPPGDPLAPTPVFVDDSGRRHRAWRLVGGGLGALVLGYVAVVAMTFAGVPLVGRLAPPGVAQLSRPASQGEVSVAPGAQETPLPAFQPGQPAAPVVTTTPAADDDPAVSPTVSTTATAPATTTTVGTVPPGQGATTSLPPTNSTVPDHTRPTGRPTDPPGKP